MMSATERRREQCVLECGRAITCEQGHVVATVLERTAVGWDDDWMEKMSWQQPAPENGEPSVCATCGRLWLFHFTEEAIGWLPDSMPIYKRTSWLCVDGKWSQPLTSEARKYLDDYT